MILLAKIFDFSKKYWWLYVILAIFVYSQLRISNIGKILDSTVESNEKQIITLKEGYDQEIKKREDAIKEYKEKISSLENEYSKQKEELEKERNKKIKIIIKYYDNPEKLSSKIIEEYGFTYEKINSYNN